MANENVKIIVQEDNQTQPRGAGVSSDIAYVPGLAVDSAIGVMYDADGNPVDVFASRNVPTLCTTVEELRAAFGDEPYKMTAQDIADMPAELRANNYYIEGDYDRSYIYAKELINAGIAVLYENIAAPEDSQKIIARAEIVNPEGHLTVNPNGTYNYNACYKDSPDTNELVFNLSAADPLSDEIEVKLGLPSEEGLITFTASELTIENSVDGIAIESVYADPDADVKVITGYKITLDNVKANLALVNFKFSITATHALRKSEDGTDFTLTIDIIDVDDNAGEIVSASKIRYFYDNVCDAFEVLADKNEYNVKYITSGGYPNFLITGNTYDSTLADKMQDIAYRRGDAVALIDHDYNPMREHIGGNGQSLFEIVNRWADATKGTFATMFTPYGRYSCVTAPVNATTQLMPASFGYLLSLAATIKTSHNWLAMAGVSRGMVPNLKSLATNILLSNTIAENMQPKFGTATSRFSINAITNVKPYGLTIWGNRTLALLDPKGTTAVNFLNTRNMVSDIKKLAYDTAKKLMFEQNSDSLWLRFKSGVSPLLDQLKSGYGISNYKIIKGTTKYNGQPLTNGELAAVIKIYPIYAVEYFEITVVMADEDVTVE